jgi:hypothetical protein
MAVTLPTRKSMTKPEKKSAKLPPTGRFAYDGLDRVFHEKARLGIMTSLSTQPGGLSFSDLKSLCALSDGNLNRHLAVLQEAGFVQTKKDGGGRGSHTLCLVTRRGERAFFEYLQELERVLADAAQSTSRQPGKISALRAGWSAS